MKGLQNYWPFQGTTKDVTGGKNMTLVTSSALSVDRFGAANSSLAITRGYATVPPGVYFDPSTGGFTIMLWVKMLAFPSSGSSSRFIDLGIRYDLDNFKLGTHDKQQLRLVVYKGNISKYIDSVGLIQLNQWTHIAATVNDSNAFLYINGILDGQITGLLFCLVILKSRFLHSYYIDWLKGIVYNAVQRNLTYIGRGLFPLDSLLNGVIDDLKIFSRGLNQEEIVNEMNVVRPLLN